MIFPIAAAQKLLALAIAEDVGTGDITSRLSFPADYNPTITARMISKASGIIAGLPLFDMVIEQLAPHSSVHLQIGEGASLHPGDLIALWTGPVREILTAERTILNFLQHLSGVASLAHQYALAAVPAQILDTRKTLPGWRELDKYAVQVGGAQNHRMGLFDMVLIKDNHIAAAGSVAQALDNVFAQLPSGMRVEIEVENLEMLNQALAYPVHRIMLDNMDNDLCKQCVHTAKSQRPEIEIEASGNMTLERIPSVAATGVDFISVGGITHSVPAFDISLRLA